MFELCEIIPKRHFRRGNLFPKLKEILSVILRKYLCNSLKYANYLYAQRYSKRKQTPINYNKNFESIWLKTSIYGLKLLGNNIKQCHKRAEETFL